MVGTYFDFSNTPITSDTTLKAKWCGCGGEPEDDIIASFYQGQGARVTLRDGRVGYMNKSDYQQLSRGQDILLLQAPGSSGGIMTGGPVDFVSVEFGTDGTDTLQMGAFNHIYYPNLRLVTGILDHVPIDFLFNGYMKTPELLVKLVITAPDVGQGFICSRGNAYGQVIFNCPTSAFANVKTSYNSAISMLNLAAYNTSMPTVDKGFAIGGTAADYVLTNFPNAANYRKLYKLT